MIYLHLQHNDWILFLESVQNLFFSFSDTIFKAEHKRRRAEHSARTNADQMVIVGDLRIR